MLQMFLWAINVFWIFKSLVTLLFYWLNTLEIVPWIGISFALDLIKLLWSVFFQDWENGRNGMCIWLFWTNQVNCAYIFNDITTIEYGENGFEFWQVHNKMEIVWVDKLHPLQKGESIINLADYNLIRSNEDIILA